MRDPRSVLSVMIIPLKMLQRQLSKTLSACVRSKVVTPAHVCMESSMRTKEYSGLPWED